MLTGPQPGAEVPPQRPQRQVRDGEPEQERDREAGVEGQAHGGRFGVPAPASYSPKTASRISRAASSAHWGYCAKNSPLANIHTSSAP